jgi:ubiquinone/menaquinone biosynthesis C-methylase UbiE
MERPEDAARRVFGERAAFYTTSDAHTDPDVLGRVTDLVRPHADMTVLDVGTGTGHTALAVAPKAGHVIGADLTPEMLCEARMLRDRQGRSNVTYCVADVHRLPFESSLFHAVTCRRAGHHFSDICRSIAEIRRVLLPGGILVVDDRSVPEEDALDELMNRLDTHHDASHVREYRPSEWSQMLTGAGFEVRTVEPYTQHRPLRSLTQGVEGDKVSLIDEAIADLAPSQRRALGLTVVNEEIHFNHFFVMLSAVASEADDGI